MLRDELSSNQITLQQSKQVGWVGGIRRQTMRKTKKMEDEGFDMACGETNK